MDISKTVGYSKEISCKIILWMQIHLFRLSNLNQLSLIHNSDLISKYHCLFLIMRYKNHCNFIFLLDFTDFFPHFYPEFRIQITKRFIQKKHLRFCDQRSDQCYSLLLSSGNFPDRCPGIFFHIYDFQIFHPHFSGFFFSDATELQTIDHIFQNTHMWK